MHSSECYTVFWKGVDKKNKASRREAKFLACLWKLSSSKSHWKKNLKRKRRSPKDPNLVPDHRLPLSSTPPKFHSFHFLLFDLTPLKNGHIRIYKNMYEHSIGIAGFQRIAKVITNDTFFFKRIPPASSMR